MSKVIDLKSRVEHRKLSKVDARSKDLDIKFMEAIKKSFKRKKTVELTPYELACLTSALVRYLSCIPTAVESFIEKEDEDIKQIIIDDAVERSIWILNTIKKIYKKYENLNLMQNCKLQVNCKDAIMYKTIIYEFIDFNKAYDEVRKKEYYKKDYNELLMVEKSTKYLYALFDEVFDKLDPFKIDLEKWSYNVEHKEFKDILKYYKDSYIKEYSSKVSIMYECDCYYDSYKGSLYYIKSNRALNRRLSKYKGKEHSEYFDYWDESDECFNKEVNISGDKSYLYGEGWRLLIKTISYDEYMSSSKYSEFASYEEALRCNVSDIIKTIPEFDGLDIRVLLEEDVFLESMSMDNVMLELVDAMDNVFNNYISCDLFKNNNELIDTMVEVFC